MVGSARIVQFLLCRHCKLDARGMQIAGQPGEYLGVLRVLKHPPQAQVVLSNAALHAQRHGTSIKKISIRMLALACKPGNSSCDIKMSVYSVPLKRYIVGPHAQFHIKGSKVRVLVLV